MAASAASTPSPPNDMSRMVDFPAARRRRDGGDDLPPLPVHLPRTTRRRRVLVHFIFISVPVVLAFLYLAFNASDRYEVSSDFTILPLIQPGTSVLPARNAAHLMNLTQQAAPGADDAYMVVDYLKSADALKTLEAKVGFMRRYRGRTRDLFFRPEPWLLLIRELFSGKRLPIPFEDKLAYYNAMVRPRYSITENIVTLDVEAFTPQDAHVISATLLRMGETFINRTNDQVLHGLAGAAVKQVAADARRLNGDHRKMKEWRGANSDLNPDQLTAMVTHVIQGLENSLVNARAAMAMDGSTANSVARKTARLRVQALEGQIATEQHRLAHLERAYAGRFYEYDRLKEDIQFAKNTYQADLASLQTFRELAAQQGIYLLRISDPRVPDEPAHPQWWLILSLTLMASAMAYGILRMIMALARDKWR